MNKFFYWQQNIRPETGLPNVNKLHFLWPNLTLSYIHCWRHSEIDISFLDVGRAQYFACKVWLLYFYSYKIGKLLTSNSVRKLVPNQYCYNLQSIIDKTYMVDGQVYVFLVPCPRFLYCLIYLHHLFKQHKIHA